MKIVRNGLLIGLLLAIWFLAEYLMGLHGQYRHIGRYTGYASVIVLAGGLQLTLSGYRNRRGSLSLSDAIMTGTVAGSMAALVLCCMLVLYYQRINPELVEKWQQTAGAGARASVFIKSQVLAVFISTITGSILISAVIGFFLRRPKQQ